jgi:hypothetical protein
VDADWSVELGADDPALELPWSSPDGTQSYVDLSQDLSGLDHIAEATLHPPLRSFLCSVNRRLAEASPWLSVKCDAWIDKEVEAHAGPLAMQWRMASYVDVMRRDVAQRFSFERHEQWAKAAAERLRRFPDGPYFCEVIIRRCYYHLAGDEQDSVPGIYITLYVFGYGDTEVHAESSWKGGLDRVAHVLLSEKF